MGWSNIFKVKYYDVLHLIPIKDGKGIGARDVDFDNESSVLKTKLNEFFETNEPNFKLMYEIGFIRRHLITMDDYTNRLYNKYNRYIKKLRFNY